METTATTRQMTGSYWPRRVGAGLVLVILIGLTVALALGFRRDPHDIKTGTVGKPAPVFELDRLDGSGRLSLAAYQGKVVIINFWASWCIPCKQENPALVRVWERYRTSDVVLIGILYQDSFDSARRYVRDNGVNWPTLTDDDGRIAF